MLRLQAETLFQLDNTLGDMEVEKLREEKNKRKALKACYQVDSSTMSHASYLRRTVLRVRTPKPP